MQQLVSIIMPMYNVEKYIEKAIQSVLSQTYNNFELLIINDGTKDNSVAIAEKFLSDKRIKIYHKENGGLSDARNFGLDRANGVYVYFMDSDDYIEPILLEKAVNEIENSNADILIFGYYLDNENANGNLLNSERIVTETKYFEKNKNNLFINDTTMGLLGYAWNKLYKLEFLNNNNLRFEKGVSLVEDILFNSLAYKFSNKILIINVPLYHYANRPVQTLIKTFHKNSFDLYLKKNIALENFFTSWNVSDKNKKKYLAISLISGIRYCANNLFSFKNELSEKEKYAYLKKMLNHEATIQLIKHYKPISLTDKMYKIIILRKSTLLLYIICKILK